MNPVEQDKPPLDTTAGLGESALGFPGALLYAGWSRLLVSVQLVRHFHVAELPRVKSAADIYRDFQALASFDREVFVAVLLDQKNRVTGVHVVSVGSLAASLVHPREVFKVALLGNAAAIIVLHNHPSGDPTPSSEDREITARLKAAGETLGIALMDHVVVGAGGYRSFQEAGLI